MVTSNNYREYFDIDERYFPCIDDAAINAGAPWDNTYPHTTFINMLTEMERALSRQNNGRTLWIEGAYGTGKSQCAHALRKILDVPEAELRAYWDRYDPLKTNKNLDLLERLIRHKQSGILTVYRYASGGIRSPRDLFFAIQESVKSALVQQNIAHFGENTIKESVIDWLEDADHKLMFNSLLQNPDKEWKALFSQSTVDEILNILRKSDEVKTLVNNIFRLADKEGITAFFETGLRGGSFMLSLLSPKMRRKRQCSARPSGRRLPISNTKISCSLTHFPLHSALRRLSSMWISQQWRCIIKLTITHHRVRIQINPSMS
jgi:hypothetical protein